MTESDFNTIFPEESKLYHELIEKFKNVSFEDGNTLFELSTDSLALADRWNEIYSQCRRGTHVVKDYDKAITIMNQWSHNRYRTLVRMHEFTRTMFKQVNEKAWFYERNEN